MNENSRRPCRRSLAVRRLLGIAVFPALLWTAQLHAQPASGDPNMPEFARLPDLHSLHSLQLGPETDDAALAYVKDLQNLRDLGLQEAKITNDGMKSLSGLVHLQKLSLSQTHVGDAGLEHLRTLAELRCLRLADTAITGMGLAALKPLGKLEILDLHDQDCIFDDDLVHLKRPCRLERTRPGQCLVGRFGTRSAQRPEGPSAARLAQGGLG